MTTILIHITGPTTKLPAITQAIAKDLRRLALRNYPAGWIYDNCADGQDEARRIEVTNVKERTQPKSASGRAAGSSE